MIIFTRCPKCGAKIKVGIKKCPKCGTNIGRLKS